ncbi:unnamed protein product [Gadus morhua 'NCC']
MYTCLGMAIVLLANSTFPALCLEPKPRVRVFRTAGNDAVTQHTNTALSSHTITQFSTWVRLTLGRGSLRACGPWRPVSLSLGREVLEIDESGCCGCEPARGQPTKRRRVSGYVDSPAYSTSGRLSVGLPLRGPGKEEERSLYSSALADVGVSRAEMPTMALEKPHHQRTAQQKPNIPKCSGEDERYHGGLAVALAVTFTRWPGLIRACCLRPICGPISTEMASCR